MKQIFILSWFDKSTLKHLRLPFSFFLMPVFLFALSQASSINWVTAIIAFLILHLFIFPSSNGYNSYQDRDETSIGGLKNPPKVSKNLFYVTLMMDIAGLSFAFLISAFFSILVLIFVFMSRAYSYRKVRLKKYPIIGFITVFIFQGAFVYLMSIYAITSLPFENIFTPNNIICMSVSSLFMGSVYPLTQIYQHEADKNDGVISLSYKLGYVGTFVFSAILFSVASILMFYNFSLKHQLISLVLFFVIMLPVVSKLSIWFNKVRKDTSNANFENTMTMNFITSVCMNSYFLILIFNNYFTWF
jgi:1,4-dihydroxy-2-naphthoate polyprenyltransferase